MRLICCFKIYDLVVASKHMILVLNTIVNLSFQQRIARLTIANGVTGLINARSVRTVIKQSMANVNVSQVLQMSLFQFENAVNAPLNILLIVCILGARCFPQVSISII